MTGPPAPGPRPSRPARALRSVRPVDLAPLAFLGPVLLLAVTLGPAPLDFLIAVPGALLAAVLGRPWAAAVQWARTLPAVAAVAGPVALAAPGLAATLLAVAAGVGVLVYLALVSDAPAPAARRVVGAALPVVGVLAVALLALATPGISAGPGAAALLLLAAVFVTAYGILGGPGPRVLLRADLEAPEAPPTG